MLVPEGLKAHRSKLGVSSRMELIITLRGEAHD